MSTAQFSTDAERRHFIRYTRTRHWPMLQRFPVTDELHDELLAQMLGCPAWTVRTMVDALTDQARETAAEMLADVRFRDALRALPFRPEDRIVAVGDSITADRLGWFELLSAATAALGAPAATLLNLGVSGNTTADVLERFDLLEAGRPTHVLLMLGTNDARSHGRDTAHRMATAPETERNLRAIVELVDALGATATVITPPAVDQQRIDGFFAAAPLRWHAGDIAEVAEVARKVAPNGLDLHTVTQAEPADAFLETDGVHPTPAGQRLILTHVVEHLTAGGLPTADR
ncbi:SGNH/GDSL hydrolase family protein [Actinoplanes sp. NPDC049599]|uniref:SGNH/GDSL hydrolase family protein n=1 Tax=Actinoplanes sp. NPDC049599 TaxID=3363903 RepID=UPI00379EC701